MGSPIIGKNGEIYIVDLYVCALFQVNLTLTSPTGAESWTAGTVHDIRWTSSGIATVKIEYSTDNGSTWKVIADSTAAAAGSYSWTVPRTISEKCLVKISNPANTTVFDKTKTPFAITAPPQVLTLTSPVGGETWVGGTVHDITWTSSEVEYVKIDYSTDNGSTWKNLTSSRTASTGRYSWTIPNISSSKCLVKIGSTSNSTLTDQSDNTFTLSATKTLAVNAPPEAQAGVLFQIEVLAKNVTDLFGASFVLKWDHASLIDSVIVGQGDFLGDDVIFSSWVDKTAGNVSIGMTRKAGQSNVSGSGVMARVSFLVKPLSTESTVLLFTMDKVTANKGDGTALQLAWEYGATRVLASTIPVWPGDTNNNGTVDQADILPLGLYWAAGGAPRQNPAITWSAQQCPRWTPLAATYADANGDGIVNQNDVLPIGLNWGKTHAISKKSAFKTVAGGAEIQPSSSVAPPIAAGIEFFVDVNVKDTGGLFGLGFTLTYNNADCLEPVTVEPGAFLGNDVLFFPQIDKQGDRISAGITRKSGQNDAMGAGTVVRVKFKASKAIGTGTGIVFSLSEITANNSAGEIVSITPLAGYIGDPLGVWDRSEPYMFSLEQNHPNPFNPETVIAYTLGAPGVARIDIFNVSGQRVRTLVDGFISRGHHEAIWDGRDHNGKKVSAGMYLYRLRAGSFIDTRKMTIVQ